MIVSSLWVCTFGSTLHWCNIRPTLCFHRGLERFDIINILWLFRLFVSKTKVVVCPHCHESVVEKGMREHIALTCTMVPLDIKKEMKGRMGLNQEGRIREIFMGAVIFFFASPFTLMPFFFYQMEGLANNTFELIFFYAFSIPFMMGGLFFQWIGLRVMRGTWEWWKGSFESQDLDFWERHDHP